MEGAAARLEVLARQIALQPTSANSEQLDVAAFQRLLDHDNWETRQRMKELMDGDLFTPCAVFISSLAPRQECGRCLSRMLHRSGSALLLITFSCVQ